MAKIKIPYKGDPVFLTILICILVTVLVGGVINYYLSSTQDEVKQTQEDQITTLEKQVKDMKANERKLDEGAKISLDSTYLAQNWNIYQTKTLGISFRYPTDWQVYEDATNKRIYVQTCDDLKLCKGEVTLDSNLPAGFARIWIDYGGKEVLTDNAPGFCQHVIVPNQNLGNVKLYTCLNQGQIDGSSYTSAYIPNSLLSVAGATDLPNETVLKEADLLSKLLTTLNVSNHTLLLKK